MIRKLAILFYEMFKISLFVLGGGYAIIATADETFSKKRGWIKEGELLDQLSLFQMIPGILAGHAAVYVGRKIAGLLGSVVAILAITLPSIIIFSFVSMGYDNIPLDNKYLNAAFVGLRASITAVILTMMIKNIKKNIRTWKTFLGLVVATSLLLLGVNVIILAISAIFMGILYSVKESSSKGKNNLFSFSLAPFLFLQYGCLAFGGGYVLIPFYLQDFVGPNAPYLNIPAHEFANLIALTQMTPGPIGINGATFFGYRLWGIGGAMITSLCLIIPGFIILSLALHSLEKFKENLYIKNSLAFLRPLTSALMVTAFFSFAGMSLYTFANGSIVVHPIGICLVAITFLLQRYTKLSIIQLIFLSALLSLLYQSLPIF